MIQAPNIDKEKKKKELWRQDIILNSDLKKQERLKERLQMEIKQLKRKLDQINTEIASKEADLKKSDQEIVYIQEEIHHLKRQMNQL